MENFTKIPVFPNYEILPYVDSNKFRTIIRKKHTDELWYKFMVVKTFSKEEPIESQFKRFLSECYIAQHLFVIHPTLSDIHGNMLIELDEDQMEERERLMRDYSISIR